MTLALAMILSYVESQLPLFVAIPGMKLGLANVAVVYALYAFGGREAALVSVLRVCLVSLLFGNGSTFFYSAAGAGLSLLAMLILKKSRRFSAVGVSMLGGVMHNVGQIAMAGILLGRSVLLYYLPLLLVSGTVAGCMIGLLAGELVKRVHGKK